MAGEYRGPVIGRGSGHRPFHDQPDEALGGHRPAARNRPWTAVAAHARAARRGSRRPRRPRPAPACPGRGRGRRRSARRGGMASGGELGDERRIDLELVDGQPVQVRQRGVAGAEVVDRGADPDVVQPADHVHRQHGVVHDLRLGELAPEAAGRQPRLLQQRLRASRPGCGRRGCGPTGWPRPRASAPPARQALACDAAVRATKCVSWPTRPDSSASSTTISGLSGPRCGWSQRKQRLGGRRPSRRPGRRPAGSAASSPRAGRRRAGGAGRRAASAARCWSGRGRGSTRPSHHRPAWPCTWPRRPAG